MKTPGLSGRFLFGQLPDPHVQRAHSRPALLRTVATHVVFPPSHGGFIAPHDDRFTARH